MLFFKRRIFKCSCQTACKLAELFKRHLMLLCLILGQIVRCVIHLEISIIMDAG